MMLPQTLFQLVAVLLLVVPGIVFTAVRRYLRGPGPDEKDFSVRLVHAIAASAIFDCIYLIAAGPPLLAIFFHSDGEQPAVLERHTGDWRNHSPADSGHPVCSCVDRPCSAAQKSMAFQDDRETAPSAHRLGLRGNQHRRLLRPSLY